eukprot:6975373-Pyramimonas_sp.AAC.1
MSGFPLRACGHRYQHSNAHVFRYAGLACVAYVSILGPTYQTLAKQDLCRIKCQMSHQALDPTSVRKQGYLCGIVSRCNHQEQAQH